MTIHVEIATQAQAFPSGTVAGMFRFHCTCAAVGYDEYREANETYVDFVNATLPGTYTVTAARVNEQGAQIGPQVSDQVTIPNGPDVIITVPVGITLNLQ